ncbi:MAG: phosphoglycerate dehydrogenase [SAR202 cluster bacterium Io17-Chloro-G7]|nr:MAG: phosphoglycerate dehydrogenase [SAR202 cluster bacterium Io17-Chloro-G7]
MPKILIADPIAKEGIEFLKGHADVDVKTGMKPEELLEVVGEYDALVVRSETKVTAVIIEAAKKLQVVGRAGIGVDNIDLDAATSAGIAVVNAPTGNTFAAAEHTLALMLALSRNIPSAHQSMKQGEWKRGAFMGIEVRNKTLGVIGLGRVGSEVARRAQSFGMRLIAYDPFVAPDYARRLGAELLSFEDVLAESDFITLHTPLTDSSRNLISTQELARMKPSARLINVARGELVDENALLEALNNDQLAGVALDVFAKEPPGPNPLLDHPKVVITPHLGASTQEAQREVAVEAAEQVLAVLKGEPARNTVNAPFVAPEVHSVLEPYIRVATVVGKLVTHLAEGQFVGVTISYLGEITQHDTTILKAAVLAGVLGPVTTGQVNLINASRLAQERGLSVTEQQNSVAQEYTSLISATLETTEGRITLTGTSMRNEPHIVKFNEYWLDIVPNVPYLLFVDNQDQPGSIGAVGTVAGRHNINISFMEVGRLNLRGRAMMVLGLDDEVPPNVMEEINALSHIYNARLVKL